MMEMMLLLLLLSEREGGWRIDTSDEAVRGACFVMCVSSNRQCLLDEGIRCESFECS